VDREALEKILPHRHPFLFLDRIEDLVPGVSAVGIRRIPLDEFWIPGHYPGQPVFPGVLIAEIMAQVGAVVALTANADYAGKPVYLAGYDRLRFRRPVRPGDELRVQVTLTETRSRLFFFEGKATVDGQKAADGAFLATSAE